MELSVVIPCKNEEDRIGLLLSDLKKQTLVNDQTPIFIADAGSTDDTLEEISRFQEDLNITVIPGGIPSVGRNQGAKASEEPYVVFIDADIRLPRKDLIEKSIQRLESGMVLVTTHVRCPQNRKADRLYRINNQLQRASRYHAPFCTGMFMAWNRKEFWQLGGFDEEIHFAEDYQLSKKVAPRKFEVIRSEIWSPDRRFEITGTWGLLKMMVTSFIWRNNRDKIKGDKGYCDHLD